MLSLVLNSVFLLVMTTKQPLDITTLFSYLTGATAFLFIMVTVLIFVYVYDNMRRGRKTTATE
jgi:hypothetical protein